jgi:hypothetical protein
MTTETELLELAEREEWLTLECERAHYVDRGRDVILCDRLPSPVTLVVKLARAATQTPEKPE